MSFNSSNGCSNSPRWKAGGPQRPGQIALIRRAVAGYLHDLHPAGPSHLGPRVGWQRPLSARDFSVWCSQRDIVRLLEHAVAAPASVRYDIVFGTSRNRWGYRDLEHPRTVLGWEPLDEAESHR